MKPAQIKARKREFNYLLLPMKEMLRHRKESLAIAEWTTFVESIKNSIIRNPGQHLGADLPSKKVIAAILDSIFEEFVSETLSKSDQLEISN